MEVTVMIIIYVLIIGLFLFETWLDQLNYKNRHAEIPKEVQDIYKKEEYEKWLEYTMENHRFSNISSTVSTLLFVLLLIVRFFPAIHNLTESVSSSFHVQTLLFLGTYYVFNFIIGIPFSYYRTFKIEEKYGFNKTTKKTFVTDKIKGLVLTFIFGGGFIYLLTTLYQNVGDLFFIYTWISILVILFVIQILYVPVIVPIFNKLTPLEEGELQTKIHEFATKVGYEVSKISTMDASKRSTKLNAFFSGFGKFKQIVLYDTLIEKMSDDEIVAVLAHEIGHNKHKHIWFLLFQQAVILSIYIGVLLLVLSNDVFSTAFGFSTANFGFSIILFTVLLNPISILLNLITSTISRKFEFQADHYAAYHFNKESIEGALKVLSKENFSNLTPHPLYVKLLYTHPPTVERIRAIRKVEVQ